MTHRVRLPRLRITALLIDWAIWGYLSYCTFFLVNYLYQTFIATSIHDRLTYPGYGWPLATIGSLFIAILWENLGVSIAYKTLGLALVRKDGSAITLRDRLRRGPLAVLNWTMVLAATAMLLTPLTGLATLLWNIVNRLGVSFVPAVRMWPLGPWHQTLAYTIASLAALAVAGFLAVYTGTRWIHWSLGTRRDLGFWSDRVSRTRVLSAEEVAEGSIPPRRWFQTSWGLTTAVLILITLCVGWLMMEVDIGNLIRRAPTTARTWGRLLNPDFSTFLNPDPLLRDSIGSAMLETIFMALLATLLGVAFAFPMSFLGARNLMGKGPIGWGVYTITRAFFNVFRSVEVLIWAIVFAVWVSFGPFAGVLALAIHTIAALGKLYSEQVESIDPGPLEAIAATGARRWQVVQYGVIPQVVPSFLAFTMYRWDINVRMSTIIGLVGGGGIGRMLWHYKNELMWEKAGAVLLAIIAVVWSMDYISGRVRARIT